MKQTSSQPPSASKQQPVELQAPGGQKLLIEFDQPLLSSDAGLLVLASDPWTKNVLDRLSGVLEEVRRSPRHSLRELLAHCLYGVGHGRT